jgi:cytochrome c2
VPEEQRERHYDIGKLNKWFAAGAGLLLIATIGGFAQDYDREWKRFQRDFRRIDREITRGAFEQEAELLAGDQAYAEAYQRALAAEAALDGRRDQVRDADGELRRIQAEFATVNSRFQDVKGEFERARYRDEQARVGMEVPGAGLEPERTREDLQRWTHEFEEVTAEFEAVELHVAEANERLLAFDAGLRDAQRELNSVTQAAVLIKRKLETDDPGFARTGVRIANFIRDLPILDLSQPTLKVNQVVLPGITENLNFAQVPRVDRCATCHLGITRADLGEVANPHGGHPQLDLMLTPESPHPLEEFGCTTCHGGRGRATDFVGTVHSPDSEVQAVVWQEEYGWEEYHLWDEPMLPARYTEAGCFQCHSGQRQVPGAEKLSLGLNVIEQAGCYSCHQVDYFENQPKRGPSLLHVADKITPEFAFLWIKDPAAFRADAWMPSYFGQTNNSTAEDVARADQEINAMVSFLFASSTPYTTPTSAAAGDPVRGEVLVASVGCLACHQTAAEVQGATVRTASTQQDLKRQFGPNFAGIGSKVTADWLVSWLKDPRSYHPATRMPNLRLTDQEAVDIAAYLGRQTDAAFLRQPVAAVNADVIDAIALDFLSNTAPLTVAREQLGAMAQVERMQLAGERLVGQYGCYACHDIAGFENARPIGAELTNIGNKSIHQFDFGFGQDVTGEPIEESRVAWWEAKISDPRVFDYQRDVEPQQRLRMPNFRFTETQVEAVVTALAGFKEADVSTATLAPRTPRRLRIEAGEHLVRQLNCQGCHVVQDTGGAIQPTIQEWLVRYEGRSTTEAESLAASFSPPDLVGEGAKVQTDWLFDFFEDPQKVRPWLSARMPSFALSAQDRNTLIAYFAALDNAEYPFIEPVEPNLTAVERASALTMFSPQYFNCTSCHIQGTQLPTGPQDSWAPNFALARDRLRPDWIIDWIRDPSSLLPGTKMPSFYPFGAPDQFDGDNERQLRVLRDHLLTLGASQ